MMAVSSCTDYFETIPNTEESIAKRLRLKKSFVDILGRIRYDDFEKMEKEADELERQMKEDRENHRDRNQ